MNKKKLDGKQSLNDSDDSSLIFQNPILKRKPTVKLLSPSRKRAKTGANKSQNCRSRKRESIVKFIQSSSDSALELPNRKTPTCATVIGDKNDLEVSPKEGNDGCAIFNKASISPSKGSEEQNLENPVECQLSIEAVPDFLRPLRSQKIANETLVCPLCPKTFDSKLCHLSHMKQCAKKKNFSTAQLLEAVENQRAGSSSTIKQHCQRIGIAKKKVAPSTTDDASTMAVALAISESAPGKSPSVIDRNVLELQKVTLEKFGFTTSGGSAKSNTRRGKGNAYRNNVLKSRSAEDRLKLLTEKAAVILLSEEDGLPLQQIAHSCQPETLQFQASTPKLWELGWCESDGPWYLENFKESLMPQTYSVSTRTSTDSVSTVELDQADSNLSFIHEESQLQPTCENTVSNTALNKRDDKCEEFAKKNASHSPSLGTSSNDDLRPFLEKQSLLPSNLVKDWNKMVNNKEHSDLSVNTSDGQVFLHSLVLWTRCPGFFGINYESIINEMTSSALLVFLRYIYTGELGKITRLDLDPLAKLSESCGLNSLAEVVELLKNITSGNSGSEDFIMSDSPRGKNKIINKEAISVNDLNLKTGNNGASPKAGDEADTVPSHNSEPDIEEIPIIPQEGRKSPSEIVDLTQNLDEEDDVESAERSYWSMMRREREREKEKERQREEDLYESIEREHEMKKIQSFLRQNESNKSYIENMEKEELEEFQKEREKIFQLSQSSEKDLFEDIEDDSLPPRHEEVIIVSSEEEKNDFEVSTDEDNTEAVPKAENLILPNIEAPPIPSPDFDDFFPFEGVIAMSPLPSQSLIASGVSPKTPRKVLGYDGLARSTCSGRHQTTDSYNLRTPTKDPVQQPCVSSTVISSTPLKSDSTNADSARIAQLSLASANPNSVINCDDRDSPPKLVDESQNPSEINLKKISGKRRPSTLQRMGQKIVKRSKKSLNDLRKSVGRRSLRSQLALPAEEPLSSSLVQGLSEPWESPSKTPEKSRPFVEVTPRNTPSVKILDKATPRPAFSAMKTSSLKKNLQRYGLKRSLSKTKAKKILCHIYEELHPVLNTKTGKFVKFLPEEKCKKKGSMKSTATNCRSKVRSKQSGTTSKAAKKPIESAIHNRAESCVDLNNSLSSEFVTQSESDGEDEFADLEDEMLTQQQTTSMSVEEAVTQYIKGNSELHRRILLYDPIWVEELRRCLHSDYGTKYKLLDIMDYLDKKCITFRSEAQAANNKRRNDRKKNRQSPRKRKKLSEL